MSDMYIIYFCFGTDCDGEDNAHTLLMMYIASKGDTTCDKSSDTPLCICPTSSDVIEISDEEGNSPPVIMTPGSTCTNQHIIQVSDDELICISNDDDEHNSSQPPVKRRKHKHYVPILPVRSPCRDKCINDEITILPS